MKYEDERFKGQLVKFKLVSQGPVRAGVITENEEMEQRLTIQSDGKVSFYAYGLSVKGVYERFRRKNFTLKPERAETLMAAFVAYFEEIFSGTDVVTVDEGYWEASLTNDAGDVYTYSGYWGGTYLVALSELLRQSLGIEDLMAFGYEMEPPRVINRLSVQYKRITKTTPPSLAEVEGAPDFYWDYDERITLDRDTETLELVRNAGSGMKVTQKYKIQYGVEELLDELGEMRVFERDPSPAPDLLPLHDETRDYVITIIYANEPRRVLQGSFDRNGLPADFPDFAQRVFEFILFYGLGEVLDPGMFTQARRREGDLIYLSVTFEQDGKTYYYRSEDDVYRRGDLVWVPAGKDNHLAVARVEDVEYYRPDEAPLPPERTKSVIRRYDPDEVSESDDDDFGLIDNLF